jgi:separase
VDAKKSFYVLNPGGDLTQTEERLITLMKALQWIGVNGEVPPKEKIREVLATNDLFL